MKPEAKPIWEYDCKQCIYLGSLASSHSNNNNNEKEKDTAQDFYLHIYPVEYIDGTSKMDYVFKRRFGSLLIDDCAVCLRGPYFQLAFHMAMCMGMLRVEYENTDQDHECDNESCCYRVTDYSSCLVCPRRVSLTEKAISMIS